MTRPTSTSEHCSACNKRAYLSRREARQVRKRRFPHDRLNAYRCPSPRWDSTRWHLGHGGPADRDRDRRIREATA